MKCEFTLTEMASIELPYSRKDPLSFQQFPSFHFNNKPAESHSEKSPNHKYTESPAEIILVPSSHYIENRFTAYSKAKEFNRPLFSQLNKSAESNKCSIYNPRFQTSRYPKVPLSKELSEKVENFNSFRKIISQPTKNTVVVRPSSNISITRKPTKSKEVLTSYKYWEQIKREKKQAPGTSKTSKTYTRASTTIKHRGYRNDYLMTYDSNPSDQSMLHQTNSISKVPLSPYCLSFQYDKYIELLK